MAVVPANTGTQRLGKVTRTLDFGVRRNEEPDLPGVP